ncbi:hypothetical protein [Pelolinea submarina]|uniref:Uncharacterized protein n=1 Tax=Pelolinea submarina TaxID=913107 RepID=A0A3E0A5P6_9CHLR|nr:hypothetical protein [Pelolinea submarina]REG06091.1 hypothetical protein DFR64_2519 [Pelolinea submarina]
MNNYEKELMQLETGSNVLIIGYKSALDLIFDFGLNLLPAVPETQFKKHYADDYFGQTWMLPTIHGQAEKVKDALMKKMPAPLEKHFLILQIANGSFETKWIQILIDIPNGSMIVARIYKTEKDIRAVINRDLFVKERLMAIGLKIGFSIESLISKS